MWDVFISHASEDKDAIARPLAEELSRLKYRIWYDTFTLQLGDSLRRTIDRGLRDSRFGVVILSKSFFAKEWPQRELDGLTAREINGTKVILPIWHGVGREEITTFSPVLADRLGITTSNGLSKVVTAIDEVLRAPTEIATRSEIAVVLPAPTSHEDVSAIANGLTIGLASPEQNGKAIEQIAKSSDPRKQQHLQAILLLPTLSFMETQIIHECLDRLRVGTVIVDVWMHCRQKALEDIRQSLNDYDGHPSLLATLLDVMYKRHIMRKDAPGYRQLEKIITDIKRGRPNSDDISRLAELFRGHTGA